MDKTFKDLVLSSEHLSQNEKDEFLRKLLDQEKEECRKAIFVYDYVFGKREILGWSEITLNNIYLKKELKENYYGTIHFIYGIKGNNLPDDISRWIFDVTTYSDGTMNLCAYYNKDSKWKK